MGTAVEDARAKVKEAKQEYQGAIPKAIAVFEDTVEEAINKMVELTVLDQPEHTKSLDAAFLSTLKFNVASSIETARAGVRPAFEALGAKGFTDVSLHEAPDKILSPLLQQAGDLFQNAGYNVRPLKASSWDKGYRVNYLGVASKAVTAARDLDLARSKYSFALNALRDAETDVARDEARSAWDDA